MGHGERLDKRDFEIIYALAESDMNVSKVSRDLYLDRDTVGYHMSKIKRLTGRYPRKFYDLFWFISHMKDGMPINEEEWYA